MESPTFEFWVFFKKFTKNHRLGLFEKFHLLLKSLNLELVYSEKSSVAIFVRLLCIFIEDEGRVSSFSSLQNNLDQLRLNKKRIRTKFILKLGCIDAPVGQLSVAHTRDCITNWEWKEQVNDWMACCGVCDGCLDCKSQKPRPLVCFSKLEKYSSSSPLISVSQKIQG